MSRHLNFSLRIFLAIIFLALTLPAAGQINIEVTKEAVSKVPIGLVLPDNLPEFSRFFFNDLKLSGYFDPQPLRKEAVNVWQGIYIIAERTSPSVAEVRVFSSGKELTSIRRFLPTRECSPTRLPTKSSDF